MLNGIFFVCHVHGIYELYCSRSVSTVLQPMFADHKTVVPFVLQLLINLYVVSDLMSVVDD